jgi:hypothetical protein
MKIFQKDSSVNSKPVERANRSEDGKPINKKKAAAPIKKEMSASAIKEKLAAHVETSGAAKNMAIKNTKKLGENFMSEAIKPIVDVVNVEAPKIAGAAVVEEEIKTPNTKDLTIKSDIALNDPKDTNTQEKLKSALTKGAFNFNPKEREALEKILAG